MYRVPSIHVPCIWIWQSLWHGKLFTNGYTQQHITTFLKEKKTPISRNRSKVSIYNDIAKSPSTTKCVFQRSPLSNHLLLVHKPLLQIVSPHTKSSSKFNFFNACFQCTFSRKKVFKELGLFWLLVSLIEDKSLLKKGGKKRDLISIDISSTNDSCLF